MLNQSMQTIRPRNDSNKKLSHRYTSEVSKCVVSNDDSPVGNNNMRLSSSSMVAKQKERQTLDKLEKRKSFDMGNTSFKTEVLHSSPMEMYEEINCMTLDELSEEIEHFPTKLALCASIRDLVAHSTIIPLGYNQNAI